MRIDQVIFELALGGVEYLNQVLKSQASRTAVVTIDIQLHQPRSLSVAAEDAQLLTDVPQRSSRRLALIESDGVKSERSFVQQVCAECVRPVNYAISYRFVTTLDGAAVAEKAACDGWVVEIHLRPVSEDMVSLRAVVIDFQVALVVVQARSAVIKKVVGVERVERGKRIVLGVGEQLRGDGVDSESGSSQIVIGKRLAYVLAAGINKLGDRTGRDVLSPSAYARDKRSLPTRAKLPEISSARIRGKNLSSGYAGLYLALALVIGEEKKLILDDRSADGAAELVVSQLRLVSYAGRAESGNVVTYADRARFADIDTLSPS